MPNIIEPGPQAQLFKVVTGASHHCLSISSPPVLIPSQRPGFSLFVISKMFIQPEFKGPVLAGF